MAIRGAFAAGLLDGFATGLTEGVEKRQDRFDVLFDESLDSAKRLIKHASDAGANAVKFQISDPDREVSDKKQMFSYGILKNRETGEIETVEEPLYDLLKRRSLPDEQWIELKQYSDELGIDFFSTVDFKDNLSNNLLL